MPTWTAPAESLPPFEHPVIGAYPPAYPGGPLRARTVVCLRPGRWVAGGWYVPAPELWCEHPLSIADLPVSVAGGVGVFHVNQRSV